MPKIEFEIGVKHGEFLGEIIVGLLVVSGGGSRILGTINTYKAVNFLPKTH